MFIGNRQEEVLFRASHRKVVANVHMIGPEESKNAGLFIGEGGKPIADLKSEFALRQHVHFWNQEDTCEPLIVKDSELLAKVVKAIGKRTSDIDAGKYALLHSQERKRLFNSDDLVDRANGIPLHYTLKFSELSSGATEIMGVPFKDLQDFLFHLSGKLGEIGGRIESVDIAHSTAQSAFDYYKIVTQRFSHGKTHTIGDLMLVSAYNMHSAGSRSPRVLPLDFDQEQEPGKKLGKKSGLDKKYH